MSVELSQLVIAFGLGLGCGMIWHVWKSKKVRDELKILRKGFVEYGRWAKDYGPATLDGARVWSSNFRMSNAAFIEMVRGVGHNPPDMDDKWVEVDDKVRPYDAVKLGGEWYVIFTDFRAYRYDKNYSGLRPSQVEIVGKRYRWKLIHETHALFLEK